MKERKLLENVRASLRDLRTRLLQRYKDGFPSAPMLPSEAARDIGDCCDMISCALEHLDDDLFLRTSVSVDGCHVDVRITRPFKSVRELDLVIDMLNLARGAVEGKESKSASPVLDTKTDGSASISGQIVNPDPNQGDGGPYANH